MTCYVSGSAVSAHSAGQTRERFALADVDMGVQNASRASSASIATERAGERRDAIIVESKLQFPRFLEERAAL
jgi:hypothetical protein